MQDSPHAGINNLLGRLDRELWLVTVQDGARRNGLITTAVAPASILPTQPRMLVGIARHHYSHELIENRGVLALHLIKESQLAWVWRFGTQSGRTVDKFASLETRRARHGSPVLVEALGWVEGIVETRMNIGDRSVFLLNLVDGDDSGTEEPPLTEARMQDLAPADKRQRLARLLQRDRGLDESYIETWRRQSSRD